jgi:hypothetical protein
LAFLPGLLCLYAFLYFGIVCLPASLPTVLFINLSVWGGPVLPAWLFFFLYSCLSTTQSKFNPCLCTPLTVPLSAYPVASTSLSAYSSGYVSPISSCLAYSPGLSHPVHILPCFYVPLFLLPYLYLPYLPTSMVISPVCLLPWVYYIPLSAFSPGHVALSANSPVYIPRSAYSPGFVPFSAYSPISTV